MLYRTSVFSPGTHFLLSMTNWMWWETVSQPSLEIDVTSRIVFQSLLLFCLCVGGGSGVGSQANITNMIINVMMPKGQEQPYQKYVYCLRFIHFCSIKLTTRWGTMIVRSTGYFEATVVKELTVVLYWLGQTDADYGSHSGAPWCGQKIQTSQKWHE